MRRQGAREPGKCGHAGLGVMAGHLKHPVLEHTLLSPLEGRAIEDHHVSLSWNVLILVAHLRSLGRGRRRQSAGLSDPCRLMAREWHESPPSPQNDQGPGWSHTL